MSRIDRRLDLKGAQTALNGIVGVGLNPADIISSIQTGEIAWTGTLTSTDTISSVDTTRSVVIFQGCRSGSSTADIGEIFARVDLTNATTVTATSGVAPTGTNTLKYMVVEFAAAAIKSVQPGTIADTGNSGTDTITSVATGKTLVFYQGCELTTGLTDLRDGLASVTLTNATTVTMNRQTTAGVITVGYTALEFV